MKFKDNIIKNINFYFDNLKKDSIEKFSNILIENIDNNILILGIGKSYNVGLQFCDLLRCINFKSIVLEPSKILHGDLGLITKKDIIITLSNSGNTDELYNITKDIIKIKSKNIYLLSSKINGKITENVIDNFIIPVEEELESCFKSIPTNSYLNFILYFNEVISILIKKLNINETIYKENHSSGKIGRLYTKVFDNIIKKEKCSILTINSNIKDLILSQNKKSIGCSIILDNDKPIGFVTDKDLRIYLESKNDLEEKILNIMTKDFYYIKENIFIKDIEKKYLYIPVIIDGIFRGVLLNNI